MKDNNILNKNIAKSEKGQAMIELAIVTPILLLLCFGIIDLGRMLNAQLILENASREAALAASRGIPVGGQVMLKDQFITTANTLEEKWFDGTIPATVLTPATIPTVTYSSTTFYDPLDTFRRVQYVRVTLSYNFNFQYFSVLGLAPSVQLTAESTTPLAI